MYCIPSERERETNPSESYASQMKRTDRWLKRRGKGNQVQHFKLFYKYSSLAVQSVCVCVCYVTMVDCNETESFKECN